MTIVLEIPPELEQQLQAEANSHGLAVSDYVLGLLKREHESTMIHTGAELIEYWQKNGLLGTRSDILEVETFTQDLRRQSNQR